MQCNRNQLAQLLGHDVKTIDKMVLAGMPYVQRPEGGTRSWVFDTVAVLGWMTRDDADERTKDAVFRIARAKAELKWLEYQERLGGLIDIYDFLPLWEDAVRNVKSRLLAMPGRFDQAAAAESDPAVIEKMLQAEIDVVLEYFEAEMKDVFHWASLPPKDRPSR
jgi:phage terminase Nu1 subunit (DNA packaging protein)